VQSANLRWRQMHPTMMFGLLQVESWAQKCLETVEAMAMVSVCVSWDGQVFEQASEQEAKLKLANAARRPQNTHQLSWRHSCINRDSCIEQNNYCNQPCRISCRLISYTDTPTPRHPDEPRLQQAKNMFTI
jgi:hypothetical protein